MSENLPAIQEQQAPFQRMLAAQGGMNVGAVAIEQERAIAEAQGQMALAKRFPRSMTGALSEFLEACKSKEFADTAFYSVPNRGSGPSIRFAEEAARCYGNFQYGHRELSRTDGKSEVEVYAWDIQNNIHRKRQITVMHVIDTKNGPKPCRDQSEIDNLISNKASKQMRGCMLSVLPKSMTAAGQAACKVTIAGGTGEKPLSDRILAMMQAFSRFGVNKAHIEKHLGHDIDNTTTDELADLIGIFNAIKEGGKASEYFPLGDEAASTSAATAAAITDQAKAGAAATPKPARQAKAQQPAEKKDAPEQDSKPEQKTSKPEQEPAAEVTENTAKPAAEKPAATKQQAADDDEVF